ncbi:2-nitropropane dioxygenase [Gammaproteobacteria bacterium 42_54_T18]|nr:2-nitropropane dioxygenase [Gammaproteobacteria bacterium 42_54_T18]
MSLPALFENCLSVPVIAAPMFLASGPSLVTACCKSGVVGTFPALNLRSTDEFEAWVIEIKAELQRHADETGDLPAPFGVNLIAHRSNPRLEADLAICIKHEVPLIITSLGAISDLVDAVHGYGGIVFHDVVNARHGKKAAAAGVDGLIAVAAGAGGHAGDWSPFALINELRQFFDHTILLSGCLSTGSDVAAAQMIGADLAYMGTRFLGTQECEANENYKQKLLDSSAAGIVYTPAVSGIPANFIRESVEAAGIALADAPKVDLGLELQEARDGKASDAKPWVDVWSAGQGVGSVNDLPTTAELVSRLKAEYHQAHQDQQARIAKLNG